MSRRELDFYETASWQVDALVDNLPELSGLVFCPCVGDGSLMRQLKARRPDLRFITSDIDPARAADIHGDATDPAHWHRVVEQFGRPDWVVENPPFNVQLLILRNACDFVLSGVSMMARVSFAEPTLDRGAWLEANPYQQRITLERNSFTGNGKSDNTTTDWLTWTSVALSRPFGISAYGYKPRKAKRGAA